MVLKLQNTTGKDKVKTKTILSRFTCRINYARQNVPTTAINANFAVSE